MDDATLRADCARCAGLCCVALAFDRSAFFGFDKPAGEACRHLTEACHCAIHDRLEGSGFAGCARYDCLGAGQRVTTEIFAGRSWRESPAMMRAFLTAFRIMRQVQELRMHLRMAARLGLAPALEAWRGRLLTILEPAEGWSYAALLAFERNSAAGDAMWFLSALRGIASSVPSDEHGLTPLARCSGSAGRGSAGRISP